jgi:hypothetical protein
MWPTYTNLSPEQIAAYKAMPQAGTQVPTSPAPQPGTVAKLTADYIAALQAIIDTGTVRSNTLVATRTALAAQHDLMAKQTHDLSQQIKTAEGPEVHAARAAMQSVEQLRGPTGLPKALDPHKAEPLPVIPPTPKTPA